MIHIQIFKDSTQRVSGVKISGHAGQATYGSDVICSAVSVLALSTINGLKQVAGAKVQKKVDEGDICFSLVEENDENIMAAAQILLKSFSNAIENMAKENPDYVIAVYEEVEK